MCKKSVSMLLEAFFQRIFPAEFSWQANGNCYLTKARIVWPEEHPILQVTKQFIPVTMTKLDAISNNLQ